MSRPTRAQISEDAQTLALRKSELRYRCLFETAQDGILILDGATGEIMDVNPFLLDLLDYPFAQLVGKKLWEIGQFKDIAANRAAFRVLEETEYIRYENLPLETRSGTKIQVEFVSNVYWVETDKVIQCNIRVSRPRAKDEEAAEKPASALEPRSPVEQSATAGDESGAVNLDFEGLVARFYSPLYRFALSLSRNETDAFDLTQQTFLLWASKGHQLREASKVKTWLFNTLYREFLASKRHDAHFAEMEDDPHFIEPPQLSPSIVNAVDAAIVREALHGLAERYRAPVSLFYMRQLSYREIASILDIPIGTVMSRVSRGKAELRRRLGEITAEAARKVVPPHEGPRDG